MNNGLTRKELAKATGVPFYTIKYLRELGRLKIIKDSNQRGVPVIYHPDSIKIIQRHINH